MSTTPTLLPCPFCGAGETILHVNKGTWNGQRYGEPVSVEVRHWCEPVDGQPSRMLDRVGRDEASAIAAWNRRAALTQGAGAVEPVAWPRDAAEVRQFMKGNCAALEWAVDEATPHQDDRYQLTAHDFLSAVNWWADFPHLQAAQQLQQAVARYRDEVLSLISQIDDGEQPAYRHCQEAIRTKGTQ